ncbi:histidine phosphatase family protein [Gorillibacterium sp. sgz5001074]|uniref:histidine phosphatase family protein n=1 Tax=Gorillibacterium sp. sgz5001074 TaxID=3446695 RepID=UPI003F677C38
MTQLYLIRHGEACMIKNGIVNDYGLTETGVAQARKLRDRLVRTGEMSSRRCVPVNFGTALNRVCLQHAGKTIAIVCHGGVIDCTFQYFFGLNAFEMPRVGFQTIQTSLTHWAQHEDRSWSLIKYNDARHLEA